MADFVTLIEFQNALANAGGEGARTAGALPDERLDANLQEACDEVAGRLSADFTLPASTGDTPPLLKGIVIGIAGYMATLEWKGSQPIEDRDPVVLRYQRAQAMLAQLAKGLLTIAGVTPIVVGAVTGAPAAYDANPYLRLTDEAPLAPAYDGGYTRDGGNSWV